VSAVPDLETIDSYRIVRQLGQGGMGVVYEALQTTPVRRNVALKVLRSFGSEGEATARFSAEQQALALMDHPSIAKVFDAGITDDGRNWFAMELVAGPSITEYADAQGLDLAQRIRLFASVCRAVQHAHQKGVIHRDLKPSNVLVAEQDGGPAPKVIDFGIAKAVGLRLTEQTLVTQFGAVIGTPAYMSPEQAEGTSLDIDTRADVYSLGVMLYELLVGCLPVDPQDTGYAGFIAYLKTPDTDPPTPSSRYTTLDAERQGATAQKRGTSPGRLREHLAGDLDWIVMTALEKDRNRRYDSAGALAADLERYLRREPVSARPPSAAYQFRKFVSRNRVMMGAAVLVVLALTVGVVVSTVQMVRARREAAIASQVSDFMAGLFSQSDPNETRGRQVTVREVLDRAAAQIDTGLAAQPLVQARLMQSIGMAYVGLGLFSDARPLLAGSLDRTERHGGDALAVATLQADLGYLLTFLSEFDEADSLLRRALVTMQRRFGDGDARTVTTLSNLAFNALRSQRRLVETEAMVREALPVAIAGLGAQDPAVGLAAFMHCWTLRDLGRRVAADSACEASLRMLERSRGEDAPQVAYNTLAVGHARRALGRYAEAREAYRRALALNRRLYTGDHAEIGYALQGLSIAYRYEGNTDSALAYARESLAVLSRVFDSTSTERAGALNALADVLTDLRRFDEAAAQYHAAAVIDSGVLGPDSWRFSTRIGDLGTMELQRGNVDRADVLHQRTLAIARRLVEPASPRLIGPLTNAGASAYRHGDLERAEALLREALADARQVPDDYPVEYATVETDLARLLTDLDRTDEACALADSGHARFVRTLGDANWRSGMAETVLGRCLARVRRRAEGERHLREGLERLEAGRLPGDLYRRDAIDYLGEVGITASAGSGRRARMP